MVRASSESAVDCQPKCSRTCTSLHKRSRPQPNRSTGRRHSCQSEQKQATHKVSAPPPSSDNSATNRFLTRPDQPSPQSQSFSRSYGSSLPISLTYINLESRGFSPRRPAADMGTAWYENQYTLPQVFKGQTLPIGPHESCGALQAPIPFLWLSQFQGSRPLSRTDNSARSSVQRPQVCLPHGVGHKGPNTPYRVIHIQVAEF